MNQTYETFSTKLSAQLPAAVPFFEDLLSTSPRFEQSMFQDKFDSFLMEIALAVIENDTIDLIAAERFASPALPRVLQVAGHPLSCPSSLFHTEIKI